MDSFNGGFSWASFTWGRIGYLLASIGGLGYFHRQFPNIYQRKLTFTQAKEFIEAANTTDTYSRFVYRGAQLEMVLTLFVGRIDLAIPMLALGMLGQYYCHPFYEKMQLEKLNKQHKKLNILLEEKLSACPIPSRNNIKLTEIFQFQVKDNFVEIIFDDDKYQKLTSNVKMRFPGKFLVNLLANNLAGSLSNSQILYEDDVINIRLKSNLSPSNFLDEKTFNSKISEGVEFYQSLCLIAHNLNQKSPIVQLENGIYALLISEQETNDLIVRKLQGSGCVRVENNSIIVVNNEGITDFFNLQAKEKQKNEEKQSSTLVRNDIDLASIVPITIPLYVENDEIKKEPKIKTRKPWSFSSVFSNKSDEKDDPKPKDSIIDFGNYGQYDPSAIHTGNELTTIRIISGEAHVYVTVDKEFSLTIDSDSPFAKQLQGEEVYLAMRRKGSNGIILPPANHPEQTYNGKAVIAKIKIGNNLEVIATEGYRKPLPNGKEARIIIFNQMPTHNGKWETWPKGKFFELPLLPAPVAKLKLY